MLNNNTEKRRRASTFNYQPGAYDDFIISYSTLPNSECDITDNGTCYMVTDLKNSTSLWLKDHKTMKDNILLHNRIIRSGMNMLIERKSCKGYDDIYKINEIGDSWEISISGKERYLEMFWLMMYILLFYAKNDDNIDKPDIRMGISCGPSIKNILKKYEFLSNRVMFIPNDNEYEYIKHAKELESQAGPKDEEQEGYIQKSAVLLADCFINGLINSLPDLKRTSIYKYDNDKVDINKSILNTWKSNVEEILNLPIPEKISTKGLGDQEINEITKGYILFIKFKNEYNFDNNIRSVINKCIYNKVTLISIENNGYVLNIYSDNINNIEQLLLCLDKDIINNIQISIVESSKEYPIYNIQNKIDDTLCNNMDNEYKNEQTFVRYISHLQNIAARLLFRKGSSSKTNYGYIYTNNENIIKKLLNNPPIEKEETKLSGLGNITIYSSKL